MFNEVSNQQPWLDAYSQWIPFYKHLLEDRVTKRSARGRQVSTSRLSESALRGVGPKPEYVHEFFNTSGSHSNDCAQAAVATVVAHWNKPVHLEIPRDVYDSHDKRYYPQNFRFVDAIWQDFPTDASILGWDHLWTWKEQIQKAFSKYGFASKIGFSAPFANGQDEWNSVLKRLKMDQPVVVLLDIDPLDPRSIPYTLHYSVLYHYDGSKVYLSNMRGYSPLPWKDFMESWWCRGLPWPNNFVHITATP